MNLIPSPVLNSLTKPFQVIEMLLFEAKGCVSVSAEKPAELKSDVERNFMEDVFSLGPRHRSSS